MKHILGRLAQRSTIARLLSIGACVALFGAVSAVSLKELSMSQRLSTAPDSTVVKVGSRAVTLGQLRVAHRARVASFVKARSMGTMMAKDLRSQTAAVIRPGLLLSGGSELRQLHNLDFSPVVTEPASQYADAPADMRAFCSSAQASACLYLPPQQNIFLSVTSTFNDVDPLVDQSPCNNQGGFWQDNVCIFTYPSKVVVHFTPAANYKLSSTTSCDRSAWNYQVDVHGAISIQGVRGEGENFLTGNNPTCVVRVTVGS